MPLTEAEIDAMVPGYAMNCAVAEAWGLKLRGDEEWFPSTRLEDALGIIEFLEPRVAEFKSADGWLHLDIAHWADHGACIQDEYTDEESELALDPRPYSFHIHLGLIGENSGCPKHWEDEVWFCAKESTPALAICRAFLRAMTPGISGYRGD